MNRIVIILLVLTGTLLAVGTAVSKVTDFQNDELCPMVSPDGKWLAYSYIQPGPPKFSIIRVATFDGKNPRILNTFQADNQYPTWFPSSEAIAFETDKSIGRIGYEIWSSNVGGFDATRLVHYIDGFNIMPNISVKGDVAFVTSRNKNVPPFPSFPYLRYGGVPPPVSFSIPAIPGEPSQNAIIAIQPHGASTVMRLTEGIFPKWDPTGTKIAFSAWNITTGWDVWVADYVPKKGIVNMRQLTFGPENQFAPSWSPDGKWIVFSSSPINLPSIINIWVVDSKDGSKIYNVTNNFNRNTMASWAVVPDGEYIYYCSDIAGDFDIYRVSPPIKGAGAAKPAVTITVSPMQLQLVSGVRNVLVLNSSYDKSSKQAAGLASRTAIQLIKEFSKIQILGVWNGIDSGVSRVIYRRKDLVQTANDIADYLNKLNISTVPFFTVQSLTEKPKIDLIIEVAE
jgi:hypothetical protein